MKTELTKGYLKKNLRKADTQINQVHSRVLYSICSKIPKQRCPSVFHFTLKHDILDWFGEKTYEFARPPDEPKLRLEWLYNNITSKQCCNQWLGLSFIFKRKISVPSNSKWFIETSCTIILTHLAHCPQASHYPALLALQPPSAPCHYGSNSSH